MLTQAVKQSFCRSEMKMPSFEPVPPLYNRLARGSAWLLLIGLIFLSAAQLHPRLGPETVLPNNHDGTTSRRSASSQSESSSLTFSIMVLPPLCCFVATLGIAWVSFRRRRDYYWLADQLLLPSLMSSLAGLALVIFLVYKDGLTVWLLMEMVAAVLAGGYSAIFLVGIFIVRRKYRRETEEMETELEEGTGAPQIPEVERVTSLKEDLLPGEEGFSGVRQS